MTCRSLSQRVPGTGCRNRHDLAHVQFQPLHVCVQADPRSGPVSPEPRPARCVCGWRREEVGVDQIFSLQYTTACPRCACCPGAYSSIECVLSISTWLAREASTTAFPDLASLSGLSVCGSANTRSCYGASPTSRSSRLGRKRPQAARVIEMLVRASRHRIGLFGTRRCFGYDVRARLGQRALNHHDMVREFDDEAVVRGGISQTPSASFGLGGRGRRRGCALRMFIGTLTGTA